MAPGVTRSRNVRSRCRCSMCPAIHINSRSWLRSSSTHEPSDPPHRVVNRDFLSSLRTLGSFSRLSRDSKKEAAVSFHATSVVKKRAAGLEERDIRLPPPKAESRTEPSRLALCRARGGALLPRRTPQPRAGQEDFFRVPGSEAPLGDDGPRARWVFWRIHETSFATSRQ